MSEAKEQWTGLPLTPPGMVWRIVEQKEEYHEYYAIEAFILLQLVQPDQEYVKKRAFKSSIILKKDIVVAQRGIKKQKLITSKNPERDLFDLAAEVIEARANLDKVNALLGDYPPKRFPQV